MNDNRTAEQRKLARHRNTIIEALQSGMVPKFGVEFIQVGRQSELESLARNIDNIAAGDSAFRFISGDYGAGKTFLLHLVRNLAHRHKLVTVHADLNTERRLCSTTGHVRKLYAELLSNIAMENISSQCALNSLVESFINEARKEAEEKQQKVEAVIESRLEYLMRLRCGYDFAKVIEKYWQGYCTENNTLKNEAIRWLRGEYETKTEAKKYLGVEQIVSDDTVFDMLRLLALFICQAGYCGLLVQLDEVGCLLQLQKNIRDKNYGRILNLINQCSQGEFEHLGFIFSGTPDLLYDKEKGFYSDSALRTRLASNKFATMLNIKDYHSKVLNLDSLTRDSIEKLLKKLVHIYANGDEKKYLLDSQAIQIIINDYQERYGNLYYLNPRKIIIDFLHFLPCVEEGIRRGDRWQSLWNTIKQKSFKDDI